MYTHSREEAGCGLCRCVYTNVLGNRYRSVPQSDTDIPVGIYRVHVTRCVRCESTVDDATGETRYCEVCTERLESVREVGVWVRYRTEVAGGVLPAGYYVRSDTHGDRYAATRVDALATATEIMSEQELDGRFDNPETGVSWLIDEFLETHPDVAADVEAERDSFFSRLSNW